MAIHMKVIGKVQGSFIGDVTTKGYEKQVLANHMQIGFARPHDAHSGLATGGTVARPLVIKRQVDTSSPYFMTACFNNEILTSTVVSFLVASSGGTTGVTAKATLTLKNALVVSVDLDVEEGGGAGTETVTLTYQSLEYSWMPTSTVTSYDWAAPS